MNKEFLVRHLNLKVQEHILLKDFSLNLQESTCLLGESGSGKSLLLKELAKQDDYQGSVAFYWGNKKRIVNWQEVWNVNNLSLEWQSFLESFLESSSNLTVKLALVECIINKPDFFFCEDLHNSLKIEERRMFFEFLQSQNICCFYVTNCIEDVVFFNYLIVLKNNNVALEGKTLLVLKEEKIMKLLGFSLPFYVNMSIQLGYYGLIGGIYLSSSELEEALWQSK